VVEFVGFVPSKLAVVTRYMANGSLQHMLYTPKPTAAAGPFGAVGVGLPSEFGSIAREVCVVRMALEAAQGLQHLHSQGVIHRDVAARNVLVDENLRVRVADFGFARIKESSRTAAQGGKVGYTASDVGPVKWSAPEAIRRRRYSEASDVFSFGVLLFEMVTQGPPWAGHSNMDVIVLVCQVSPRVDVCRCLVWERACFAVTVYNCFSLIGACSALVTLWQGARMALPSAEITTAAAASQCNSRNDDSDDNWGSDSNDDGGGGGKPTGDYYNTRQCNGEQSTSKVQSDSSDNEGSAGRFSTVTPTGSNGARTAGTSDTANGAGGVRAGRRGSVRRQPWHMSPRAMSPLESLMRWCWSEDPRQRPSMADAITFLATLYGELTKVQAEELAAQRRRAAAAKAAGPTAGLSSWDPQAKAEAKTEASVEDAIAPTAASAVAADSGTLLARSKSYPPRTVPESAGDPLGATLSTEAVDGGDGGDVEDSVWGNDDDSDNGGGGEYMNGASELLRLTSRSDRKTASTAASAMGSHVGSLLAPTLLGPSPPPLPLSLDGDGAWGDDEAWGLPATSGRGGFFGI